MHLKGANAININYTMKDLKIEGGGITTKSFGFM